MQRIFYIVFFIASFSWAQSIHPNDVRLEIYQRIISDLQQNLPHYPLKHFFVDATMPQYHDVEMSIDGIQLRDPEPNPKQEICKLLPQIQCVNTNEINTYQLIKIYQNHIDRENYDFYGIYPAIDQWHQLILHAIKNQMLKEKPMKTNIYLPIKHLYFDQEEVKEEHFIYAIELDKDFKINHFNRIKL